MYICICIYIYICENINVHIYVFTHIYHTGSQRFHPTSTWFMRVSRIHEGYVHTHISIWKHAHTHIYKSVFTHIHHRFTALPVDGDMMDEGVMHIRVLEPKVLGEPRSVGTASMPLRVDILKFSSKVILHVHFSSSWLLRISPTSLALSAKLACPCG